MPGFLFSAAYTVGKAVAIMAHRGSLYAYADGSITEEMDAAHVDDYAIVAEESTAIAGLYFFNLPDGLVGQWELDAYERLGEESPYTYKWFGGTIFSRTMSYSIGGSVGPTAARAIDDIYATVFKGGTVPLCARVFLANGVDATIASVATVKCTIYKLSEDDPDDWVEVTGHVAISLNAADVLYDTLQSDALASSYNFKHVPDVSEHAAFSVAGVTYLVEYRLTPSVGQVIIVRFRVHAT